MSGGTDWWSTSTEEGPACAHERTVPVYAQPTNELVALLCVDCDAELLPPEPEEETDRPPFFVSEPDYWPRPRMPAAAYRTRERAEAAISPRTRRFLYNASAAGTGWLLGLYRQFASAIADCGHTTGIGGALVLGVGSCLLIAHLWDRYTRHWWGGIAWAARIPLATALLALALWAPAAP